jgi:type IV pilus assembly protein PilO
MSFIDDLNNLDPSNPGTWPLPVKAVVILVVCVAVIAAGWHFDITKQREALAVEAQKEQESRDTLEVKQKKAANLKALKEQMKEMEQSFGDMIRQLPDRTEVAGLLVDISQTGLGAGLEFKLFKPKGEQPSEFYATLPIEISVVGTYHQIGEFVSGIAALPRIVTTHDIDITKLKGKGKAGSGEERLSMKAVAKTYRALEEEG